MFRLNKWYLDCISPEGNVFIGYAAQLDFMKLSLRYVSSLIRRKDQVTETKTALMSRTLPVYDGTQVSWFSPQLGLTGVWERKTPLVEERLHEDQSGFLHWSCILPHAKAGISFAGGEQLTGEGYVEQLSLTILPWHLPIDELRWGRFLSEHEALVWIDWKGAMPKSLLFHNGSPVADAVIADQKICGNSINLLLSEHAILRDGPIFSTALSAVPGIAALCPSRMIGTTETKWFCRGHMTCGEVAVSGYAIHEVVRFSS